jgi:hypothetical protein
MSATVPLEQLARRTPPEAFTIESQRASFEVAGGERTEGTASVSVSRSTIAIRFAAAPAFTVSKAGYGDSNGKIVEHDGSWSAPNVNDAGSASDGDRLFGTMMLSVGRESAAPIAATRLVVAGAAWPGTGSVGGRAVIAQPISRDVVSHHDRRMTFTVEGDLDTRAIETWLLAGSFVSGLQLELLRVERYAADGAPVRVEHHRGFRRLGRGAHSPFTGVADEHRMRAWIAMVEALPRLLKAGVPIDMVLDQIAAHNQVSQIHVSVPLLMLAPLTAAYHRMHGIEVVPGAASRREEMARLNRELQLGLSDADLERFEKLRVEILDAGFFHAPGYETGRPQKDIKFIRDIAHCVVFRLCGYSGPFYGAERFTTQELAKLPS